MSSRDKILEAITKNQPALSSLPDISFLNADQPNLTEKFTGMLQFIGGKVIEINSLTEVTAYIAQNIAAGSRVVTSLPDVIDSAGLINENALPHDLHDIELAVISSELGVAENGAVWINGDKLYQRVLPFISQHLAVVLKKQDIVATMHRAYEKIGNEDYGFSTFIAGPSKTADIEQSLVLGAHGSRTMTVFLVND